jgi:hypothetical protein
VYRELRNQVLYAGIVIAGALVGARFDIRGVAMGVGVAILCMFIVTGRLALSVTGVEWRQYLRTQVSALVTAGIVGGAALSVRQSLEARQAPSALIALAVLTAAAVPCSAGMLWALESWLAPFRERLGGPPRLVEAVHGPRRREAAVSG